MCAKTFKVVQTTTTKTCMKILLKRLVWVLIGYNSVNEKESTSYLWPHRLGQDSASYDLMS